MILSFVSCASLPWPKGARQATIWWLLFSFVFDRVFVCCGNDTLDWTCFKRRHNRRDCFYSLSYTCVVTVEYCGNLFENTNTPPIGKIEVYIVVLRLRFHVCVVNLHTSLLPLRSHAESDRDSGSSNSSRRGITREQVTAATFPQGASTVAIAKMSRFQHDRDLFYLQFLREPATLPRDLKTLSQHIEKGHTHSWPWMALSLPKQRIRIT